jgi:hypothetical protein
VYSNNLHLVLEWGVAPNPRGMEFLNGFIVFIMVRFSTKLSGYQK